MAGHAQLKFVLTECSKTQIRLTEFILTFLADFFILFYFFFSYYYLHMSLGYDIQDLAGTNKIALYDIQEPIK